MCKFPGKIMMLAVTALFLSVGTAVAGQSSADWNDSWGFPSTFEKSRLVEQALAIELIEEDGFNNTTNYIGTYSYDNSIGILAIDNSINDSIVDAFNTRDSFNTNDSFNKTKTTTKTITTNVNKTNNTTNTTNTNINKNFIINK